jgi:hypothetical protein
LMMAEAVNNMDNSLVNRFSIMSEKGYWNQHQLMSV